jgi:superfamily II DNA or RNA helicase
MSRTVRLRAWQKAALDTLARTERPDVLVVATPGAGKTTFALASARRELAAGARRLVVVAPTAHLKHQWASAAEGFGLHLEPSWSAADGRLPSDVHGLVTTYQQVATSAAALAPIAKDAAVVLDEVHHAGDDRAWGDAVRVAFDGARRRLCLSGTPFRSDTRAIPFVRYVGDEAVPDVEYGYAEALRDGGVVRPVYFPRTNGLMEWSAPDGSLYSATFDDALDVVRANQRLRTALSLDGEWLPAVLRSAHERLVAIRAEQSDAGGLVIAIDQDHARGIAGLLRARHGVPAVVVTSDDPTASARIAEFAAGALPWIVAVRMVSEGVDIPRLRVGVYATTTTTELFFRQAVGRLVRWQRAMRSQKAYLFIPDDPRLRAHAFQIGDQRRHSLRRPAEDAETPEATGLEGAELDDQRHPDDVVSEQLSLFSALSAVVLGDAVQETPGLAGAAFDDDGDPPEPLDDASLLVELPPPPPVGGLLIGPLDARQRREEKRRLRDANTDIARALVARTGMAHAKVNAELNRRAGVTRVSEATLEQLERRLRHGESWLRRA